MAAITVEEVYVNLFGSDHDEDPNRDDRNGDGFDGNDEHNDELSMHDSESDEDLADDEGEEAAGDEGEDDDEMLDAGPQPGMEFRSRGSLVASYQAYARTKGFCASVRNSRTNDGPLYKYMVIYCDRGRKAGSQKKTKRIDCPVRVNCVRQSTGRWRVSSIFGEHNHDLDPSHSTFMAPHRNLTVNMKRQLEGNDIAGVRICKSVRFLEVQAGGPQHVGVSARDCRNYINKRRRLRLGKGDAEAIRSLFMRLQQKDRRFFHLMDIDDRGRLRNVMWIHPRSKAAYEDFHDVVSFDTTYLVNTYQMPFATIVGVNHHHQSTLLGCALLSHEDIESFKWLFTNWLEAMGGVPPTAMLTDQCSSIKNAVREVLPDTIHRYCLWHIASKAPQKFKKAIDFHKAIKEFNALIYNSRTILEFEDRWPLFLVENGLQDNTWLRDLYAERQSWVKVYLDHAFWAGMVSTQRSESMHSFFDGYITPRSTLKVFVEQYEIAIADKIHREMQADYESKSRIKRLETAFKWEEQFRSVYTNNVFDIFQKEIRNMLRCNVNRVPSDLHGVESYEVVEKIGDSNLRSIFIVEARPIGEYFQCNCRKFESKGIFCCHVLKVLVEKDVGFVNDRYILRRWRKDVYRHHSSINFAGGYPHMTDEYKRFQEVERIFVQCTDLAYQYPAQMKFIEQRCKEMKDELTKRNEDGSNGCTFAGEDGNDTVLLNPPIIRRRGRPVSNRIQSNAERITRLSRARGGGRTAGARGGGGTNSVARGGGRTAGARGGGGTNSVARGGGRTAGARGGGRTNSVARGGGRTNSGAVRGSGPRNNNLHLRDEDEDEDVIMRTQESIVD